MVQVDLTELVVQMVVDLEMVRLVLVMVAQMKTAHQMVPVVLVDLVVVVHQTDQQLDPGKVVLMDSAAQMALEGLVDQMVEVLLMDQLVQEMEDRMVQLS